MTEEELERFCAGAATKLRALAETADAPPPLVRRLLELARELETAAAKRWPPGPTGATQ